MGDEEFGGGLDSDSFMAQLKADEVAVEEANKLLLVSTPLSHTYWWIELSLQNINNILHTLFS